MKIVLILYEIHTIMKALDHTTVENEIMNSLKEVKDLLKINAPISSDVCPGSIGGITSHILVNIIGRIGNKLGVSIPNNCYPFYDKSSRKQLSIKEATKKLVKVLKDGK
ncbi:MAG: hypothetical protein H6577_09970 [Lewinellaceae bacterium]|nr:hypothetical protein [Saprospiraceae bacterium]MCB9338443.1 hypothetical protein [Lewinellaceae bacterium]